MEIKTDYSDVIFKENGKLDHDASFERTLQR